MLQQRNISLLWLFVSVTAVVAFAGALTSMMMRGRPLVLPKIIHQQDSYTWVDGIDREMILSGSWENVAGSRLIGLPSGTQEMQSEQCNPGNAKYLREEGGECRIGVWVTDHGVEIRTQEDFQHFYGSTQSLEEAFSLVTLTTPDLVTRDDGTVQARVLTTDLGYYVQVTIANKFGCGTHEPTKQIYLVNHVGQAALVAFEIPNERGTVCVD